MYPKAPASRAAHINRTDSLSSHAPKTAKKTRNVSRVHATLTILSTEGLCL